MQVLPGAMGQPVGKRVNLITRSAHHLLQELSRASFAVDGGPRDE